MPKLSKINSKGRQETAEMSLTEYRCCECGKIFAKQARYFPMVQSQMYRGNNGYLHICKNCVDKEFQEYKLEYGDEKTAMRRMCMKLDIYWNEEIYGMIDKVNTSASRVSTYIARSNLVRYQGKTFDDTLREDLSNKAIGYDMENPTDIEVSEDIVLFWGPGMTPELYLTLDSRYRYWLSQFPEDEEPDPGVQAILRQICILETQINNDALSGKSVEKSANTLSSLLDKAGINSAQKKMREEALNKSLKNMPLGVGIQRYEEHDPLPDIDPEFKDQDNIIKYITTWFYGHLAKMVGVKNFHCQLYDEAMEKYTVKRPEFKDDDSDALFNDVFSVGGDTNAQ